jgi:hypothetical protein
MDRKGKKTDQTKKLLIFIIIHGEFFLLATLGVVLLILEERALLKVLDWLSKSSP